MGTADIRHRTSSLVIFHVAYFDHHFKFCTVASNAMFKGLRCFPLWDWPSLVLSRRQSKTDMFGIANAPNLAVAFVVMHSDGRFKSDTVAANLVFTCLVMFLKKKDYANCTPQPQIWYQCLPSNEFQVKTCRWHDWWKIRLVTWLHCIWRQRFQFRTCSKYGKTSTSMTLSL